MSNAVNMFNDYAELFLPNDKRYENNNNNRMKKILLIGTTGNVGMRIRQHLLTKPLELYSPSSLKLNLNSFYSIKKYFQSVASNEPFDYVIYCALDKSSSDFERRNIDNLQNILNFQNCFQAWIHFSSRSVYDALGSFRNIHVVRLEDLPEPNSPYSRLKYREEVLLSKVFHHDSFILRMFDFTTSENYSDIVQRWGNQILRKGSCKNELLSPIYYTYVNSVIDGIIGGKIIPGTYNLCGTQTIDSEIAMKGRVSGTKLEKTGFCSFNFTKKDVIC